MGVAVVMAALALVVVNGQNMPRQMTVAAIFDQGGDMKYELAFKHAVQMINQNRDILPGVELKADLVHIPPDDTFNAERKTCYLLEKGVVAIFGPLSKSSSEHIRSITDSMEIPYIETRWNYRGQNMIGMAGEYAFNLHPDITTLSSAYLDLMEAYQWTTITILYQDNDSMMTLKEIFGKTSTIGPMENFRIVVKQLAHNENGYRDVLKEIFMSESNLIVLDCEKKILEEVLKQCQQVGLISQGYFFFLTSLDAHTVNLDDFKYGGTNFSAYRMIDVDKPEVNNVIYSIVKSMVNQEMGMGEVPNGNLDTTTALIYDSVTAFAIALNKLDTVQQVRQQRLDCSGEQSWAHGNSLVNYMKMVEFVGLSGKIEFDTQGLRTKFELDLMELQMTGLAKVGSWNSLDKLSLARVEKEADEGGALHAMANKSFVITSILNPPYTMLVEQPTKLSGNERYEGFAIDLAAALAEKLNFNFTFKVVDDGKYGGESSPGNWNGMLGEVQREEADFCIADISITSSRAEAFTFSMPWLNLGISILYIPPRSAPPSLLAFLDPFTTDVYIYTLLVFVLVTLIIYVLARFSPNQWEEPPNCVKDPEEYENQYTFLNSFWFTLGALMQQGSDVAPIALCVRFAAGMWFFFALIMIASYTANLAAFLTVETLERPIESVEDLAGQNEIGYGAVNGGSTSKFFAKSSNDVYQRINAFMTGVHADEMMMDSNDDGVEKVEESAGKYAFFMESASIEYLVERRCKLAQVGGLLDSKGYGIATKHGTPYKPLLDWGILQLQEGGTLHRLKVKWWKQKRGGGACAGAGSGGGVSPLGLGNVAGVFLVTMMGCAIAAVFAVLEFLYGTKQSAADAGVTWMEEMTTELRFIFQCHGNTKKLRETEESESDEKSDGGSHSSRLSCGDSPPYSRRKSHEEPPETYYRGRQVEPPYGVAPSVRSAASQRSDMKSPVSSMAKVISPYPNNRSDMKSPVSSMGSDDEESSSKGKNSNPFETIDDE